MELSFSATHSNSLREFFYKIELLEDGGISTIVTDVKINLDEKFWGSFGGADEGG